MRLFGLRSMTLRAPGRRQRSCALFMGLATVMLAATGSAHGQLVNPGFEDPGGTLSGWQVFGNSVGNVTANSITPHSGSWVASVSGRPTSAGSTSYAGMTQGLASTSDVVWTASAYFRHNSPSRLQGGNQIVMKVEFYRRFGGNYGSSDFISEIEVTGLEAGSTVNQWQEATLSAPAPPGTEEARISFVFVQDGTAAGTALIDDVSLTMDGDGGGPPEGVALWLLWHDEFDGDSVDSGKWRVLDEFLIKNGELQYYDPADVYLENGRLVLRSRHHDPPVVRRHPDGHYTEFDYTSGLVESPGLFSHTYGWVEVRAKLPSTQGLWPAHWLLGDNIAQIGWPRCGEIDIMELLGHDVDTVYFTRHFGDPYVHRGSSFSGPDFSEDFHTFALHWTSERMSWYVDDLLRYTTSIADAGDIFRKPFYLILNTAVGGYWPGFPDATSVFPQYHEIEYVRWYVESEPGDFDRDGDVDADDQAGFAACFSGTDSGWHDPACRFFDSDADGDVDCDDWPSFRERWSGPPPVMPFFSECGSPPPRRSGGRRP